MDSLKTEKVEKKEIRVQKEFEIKGIYTIFREKYNEGYFFDGESHDFWELVCNLDGKLGITGGRYVYSLKSGECFFHRPMEYHRLWAESETKPEVIVVTFSCNNIINVMHGVYTLGKKERKRLVELVERSEELFYKNDIEITEIKENKKYEFQIFINELENLILNILVKGYSGIRESHSTTAEKYTAVIKIMEDNMEKRLSVSELAELCNMSVPNLKKIFKKYSGKGVMEYFSDMKIKRAKILLKEGKSVKETAYMLGFYDQNYFNVFFKRSVGISPGKYR